MNFNEFLKIEKNLAFSVRGQSTLGRRFFEIENIAEDRRDRIQQLEYEVLEKALRAKWKMQMADAKAKTLVGKIEAEGRKNDAHAKILVGIAALRLAKVDVDLRASLFLMASEMSAANKYYLKKLFEFGDDKH